MAKQAAKKFTHLAPVWFQIKPNLATEMVCTINGAHNIDRGFTISVFLYFPYNFLLFFSRIFVLLKLLIRLTSRTERY